jgi:hypothetical protein
VPPGSGSVTLTNGSEFGKSKSGSGFESRYRTTTSSKKGKKNTKNLFLILGFLQCGGSGMFIPDPEKLRHPGRV